MNYRYLRTLLEAAAITVCLVAIAGQQSEAQIASIAAINAFPTGLNSNTTLFIA